jgi:hypothetical protein
MDHRTPLSRFWPTRRSHDILDGPDVDFHKIKDTMLQVTNTTVALLAVMIGYFTVKLRLPVISILDN